MLDALMNEMPVNYKIKKDREQLGLGKKKFFLFFDNVMMKMKMKKEIG